MSAGTPQEDVAGLVASDRAARAVAAFYEAKIDRLEQRLARLEEALREIERIDSPWHHSHGVYRDIAHEALAAAEPEERAG